jgi:hypothetical protein
MKAPATPHPCSLLVDAEKGIVLSDQWVPLDLEKVFLFFSDARNLERLTPAMLHFKVISMSTAEIGEGTDIRYRLKIHGLPVRWVSRITDWERPRSFSDIQISGPYRYWCHRHIFESADGGTWIRDRVQYGLPMGLLGQIFLKGFIGDDVKKIFSYRQQVIRELFH